MSSNNSREDSTLLLYLGVHAVLFVYCFVFGSFFWAGYSLKSAFDFALVTALISLVCSIPGFFPFGGHQQVLESYIVTAGVVGFFFVLIVGLCGGIIRMYSPGPEQEILSPVLAAIIVAVASVGVGAVNAVWEKYQKSELKGQ